MAPLRFEGDKIILFSAGKSELGPNLSPKGRLNNRTLVCNGGEGWEVSKIMQTHDIVEWPQMEGH